jgi:hypothetical protein
MRVTARTADPKTPDIPKEGPQDAAPPEAAAGGATEYQRLMAGEDVVDRSASTPFRGGQDARRTRDGTATEIGTTRRGEVTQSVAVTEQNFEFLRRLDANGDGVLEQGEVRDRMNRAGATRIRNESAGMSQAERDQISALYRGTGSPISLTYGGARVGAGDGQTGWGAVERGLATSTASGAAPLGSVGQSRPTSLDNNDCGPASGLYMNDRRVRAATGHEPARTHAQADALIRSMSRGSGTTAPEMAGIMNDHFRHAGGRYYTHAAHNVDGTNLASTLMTGLAADPGGVMVPTIATTNAADTSGTRHWLVVTGFDGTNVTYYDPAGPDGARHERTMPLSELRDALPADNPLAPNQVVYGTSVPESSVAGALPVGRRVGGAGGPLLQPQHQHHQHPRGCTGAAPTPSARPSGWPPPPAKTRWSAGRATATRSTGSPRSGVSSAGCGRTTP